MKHKIVSLLLILSLLLAAFPVISPSAAEMRLAETPQSERPAYNIAAATSYAVAHWDDGIGECAQFVSTCLAAGGVTVPDTYSYFSRSEPRYWGGMLGSYTNPYICAAALLKWLSERYPVITNPAHADLAIGDIIFMDSENPDGHAGIITGFNGSMPLYSSHNDDNCNSPVRDYANFAVKMGGARPGESCTLHLGEYRYGERAHPHYRYFTCTICGKLYTDGTTERSPSCETCAVAPTAANAHTDKTEYLALEPIRITWDTAARATCYQVVIYRDGIEIANQKMWLTNAYTLSFYTGGNYRVIVSATNRSGATPGAAADFIVHAYRATVTQSTCTQQGYTTYLCKCGKTYVDDYTEPLGHRWDGGVVVLEPTETETGIFRRTCVRCPATTERSIPALGRCDDGDACVGKRFADMPTPANWAHKGIDFAVKRGLFDGVSATQFSPDVPMTRAMLVTVLWRYEGEPYCTTPGFTDVPDGQWYSMAVRWASVTGVVNGVGGNKFDPNGAITREQIAAILYRYAQISGGETDLSHFADAGSVSPWATEAISWAVAEGLIVGTPSGSRTLLDPMGKATRAQVATILMRFIQGRKAVQ